MRKISFFWRTVFTTMFAVLLTLAVCTGLFFVSTEFFEKNLAQRSFDKAVVELRTEVGKEGLSESVQKKMNSLPYDFTITKDGEFIYPYIVTVLDTPEGGETSVEIVQSNVEIKDMTFSIYGNISESEQNANATLFEAGPLSADAQFYSTIRDDSMSATETVLYNGATYEIMMNNFTAVMNKQNQQAMLYRIMPYFLVGGLLVSFIISFFYAKYFSRKIMNISDIVTEMGTMSLTEIPEKMEGDELQELQNNLYGMYENLQTTMHELDEEVAYTKKLEQDKQVFMRGATHELKTPIMTMSVMLEGMIENFGVYEDRDLYLHKAQKMLIQMERLVNEILSVSKLEHVQFEGSTEIKPIIIEQTEHSEVLLEEKKLSYRLELPDESPILPIDAKSFQKIFSNVLNNAIAYAAEHTTIAIKLDDTKLSIQNTYTTELQLTEEELTTAFVTSDEEEGHGLGLYVVDMLCKRYDILYEIKLDKEKKQFIFEMFFNK